MENQKQLEKKPCLYLLDDNGEAFDVRYFCSEECQIENERNSRETTERGTNSEWIPGTVCDWCGLTL